MRAILQYETNIWSICLFLNKYLTNLSPLESFIRVNFYLTHKVTNSLLTYSKQLFKIKFTTGFFLNSQSFNYF